MSFLSGVIELTKSSKLQTGFSRRICKRFDASVILVVSAIQFDFLDARRNCFLRDRFSNSRGAIAIPAVGNRGLD